MRNYTFYLKHPNKKTIIYYLRKNNYILTFSKKTFSHVFGGVSAPYTLFYKTTSSCFGKQFLIIKNSLRACFSPFFVVSLQHFAQHASKNKNKMEEKDIKKQASEEMVIKPIAHFHSPLKTKFGVPKQSGLASSLKGFITFTKEWRDPEALRGIDGFSYLWLIWGFSANPHKATGTTVRPPVLGGNKRMGIWATRSPFRPNNLGLSSVKIESIDLEAATDPVIRVSGADLMDGTPIYDIKPYVPYADAHPEAKSGFTGAEKIKRLKVVMSQELRNELGANLCEALEEVLALDPRPQYHNDSNRVYGLCFERHDIKFMVKEDEIIVL